MISAETFACIRPSGLCTLLHSMGWEHTSTNDTFVTFARSGVVVDVPLRRDFVDYARRVEEVVALVARVHGVSVFTVLLTLEGVYENASPPLPVPAGAPIDGWNQ